MQRYSNIGVGEFLRQSSRGHLSNAMGSDYGLFVREVIYINHTRARIMGALCVLLIGLLTALDIHNCMIGLWNRQQGYRLLFNSHCLILGVFAAFLIFSWKKPLKAPNAAGPIHAAVVNTSLFLVMASMAFITISDVLNNGSIAAYLGMVFSVASIFLMYNTTCLILFLSNMALMELLLLTVPPASYGVARIEMINVFAFTLIAITLSRILFYYHVKSFKNKVLINRQRRQLEEMSMQDHLTKAANRRYFQEVSGMEIDRANRHGTPLSLAILDLDHFKMINDTYGHHIGDSVLIELSRIVSRNKRKSDLFARWGGEEFLLLSPQTDLGGMAAMAEKLRDLIESSTFAHGGRVTASFGVTRYRPGETLEALVQRSDKALYKAKNMGRNRVVILEDASIWYSDEGGANRSTPQTIH